MTFSGAYATRTHQPVLYITERAVFELIDGALTLTEIAPGVDLQKDILALMDFKPRISPDLKLMPIELFFETWGGLRQHIEHKTLKAEATPVALPELAHV